MSRTISAINNKSNIDAVEAWNFSPPPENFQRGGGESLNNPVADNLVASSTALSERKGIDRENFIASNLNASAAPSNAAFNYNTVAGVRGNSNVTPAFLSRVEQMAERLGAKPEHLLAVMSFETSGTFSPSIRNFIGATGLIQFLPDTARGLGTSTEALARMSATEQLQYVEKYLAQPQYRGKIGTVEGIYSAILSGQARPNPNDVLFREGTVAYKQNPLDWNRNGQITSAEAATPVTARMFGGIKAVQERLYDAGFGKNVSRNKFADGQWGANSANALSDFQRSRNQPATGALDEATGRTLFGLTNQPISSINPANPTNSTAPLKSAKIPVAGLSRGERGSEVQKLQNALVYLGHLTQTEMNTGPGIFGLKTETGVKDFQRANGLSPSGNFDNATRRALESITSGVGRNQNENRDVTRGLQNKLVDLGYLTQAQVDTGRGTFGLQTEAALKLFQRDNKIQQTGVLGAQTYQALQNANPVGNGGNNNNAVPSGRPAQGPITSGFGPRVSPGGVGSTNHRGIDIGAQEGARVQSTAPGRVVHASSLGGAGNTVIIDHDNGYQTKYFHLSRIDVRVGQQVSDNQQIGAVGSTGFSTGPHLHYEVLQNGVHQNPNRFL